MRNDEDVFAQLRRIAENTTFDPDTAKRPDHPVMVTETGFAGDLQPWYYVPDRHQESKTMVACACEEDAEFIMAFNPKFALVLLDQLQDATREVDELRAENHALNFENQQLRAQLEANRMPSKQNVVQAMLSRGSCLVQLDARVDGVDVPDQHANDYALTLRIGYGLQPPVQDFTVNELGIAGTLTFGGTAHYCRIPWNAIYAVSVEREGRTAVWEADIPKEALSMAGDVPTTTKKPNHLKLVD